MGTRIDLIIDKITSDSRRLFLVDGLGAFVTAILLVAILAQFEKFFGMPPRVIYWLALVALIYTIYSFSCYFFIRGKGKSYLKAITIANIIYSCLTIALVVYFFRSLTIPGLIYFFLEIMIMIGLIRLELMAVSRI